MSEEGTVTTTGNVLENDSSVNGAGLTVVTASGSFGSTAAFPAVLQGNYGTLTIAADGSYTYDLASNSAAVQGLGAGQQATDTFFYTVTDGAGTVQEASSTLSVTIDGSSPTAVTDIATVSKNATITANGNVLSNDSGVNGSPLKVVLASGTFASAATFPAVLEGNYGTLTLAADGSYTYDLATSSANVRNLGSGQQATDTFFYAITDGTGTVQEASSTLSVTINGADNQNPQAGTGSVSTQEDTELTFDPRSFASDPDGDALTLTHVSAANGSAIISDGIVTYTPDADFNGTDTLFYAVSDGQGGTASGTVSITVTPVNDAPSVANAIPGQAASEGAAFAFAVPASTFADVDAIDGDTLTLTATGLPAWLNFNAATGTFSGTPGFADAGTYSVTVTATDAAGAQASDQFDIVAANTNRAPVAGPGVANTFEDTQFTFDARVSAGDPDGDALTVTDSVCAARHRVRQSIRKRYLHAQRRFQWPGHSDLHGLGRPRRQRHLDHSDQRGTGQRRARRCAAVGGSKRNRGAVLQLRRSRGCVHRCGRRRYASVRRHGASVVGELRRRNRHVLRSAGLR